VGLGTQFSGTGSLRADPHYSVYLCRTDGLRLGDFAHWNRVRADDRFLYGGSDEHKLRYKQHTELDSNRGDEYCHHAGDIHVHLRDWFDEREPDGDDHLHTDGYQCRGPDHVYANRYRKHKQTNNQLLLSESRKYHWGFQQYAELGDDRGDEYRHHAGDIHVHIRDGLDEREPDGDDHLHADGYQCRGLDHLYANRYHKHVKQTHNRLLLSESHKYHVGFQQHAELGDDRGDEYCYHAGDFHVHIRDWFDEREPDGDDYLHTDCYQCRGLEYIHGNSHCNSVRRSTGDNDHFMPRRNTRRSV
jgi:hypothetical protein